MAFNQTQMIGVYAIAFAISLAFCKKPAYLHYDNSIMRSHLLKCLHKISKQARNNKKYFYKGPYGPTILLLQDARDRSYVQMYNMSTLVPSRLPRDQIECSTVEAFKNCKKMSGMSIKIKSKFMLYMYIFY